MDKYAVIVAGGSGTRIGGDIPKQFLLLKDKPVLWYTLTAFLNSFNDIHIILVLPDVHFERGHLIIEQTGSPEKITLVAGGRTRFHSVQNGLARVAADAMVFVHDGVRCLITPHLIKSCYESAIQFGNAVPAISPVDSLRMVNEKGNVIVDRNTIRSIQTPQTFDSNTIKKAFEQEYQDCFTDEASVVELAGTRIHLIDGELNNIKITRPIDLIIAEKILEEINK